VLIAISGSGNSRNVIRAVVYAKQVGAVVIGLTGYDGGKLYQMADYKLHVPVNNMQITEDIHMIFNHLMMWILTYRK
jgi:D-sedoheptulose 7-phosphate isomerase